MLEKREFLEKIIFLDQKLEKKVLSGTNCFINKYVLLNTFEKNVKEGTMPFGTPEYWADPYEKLYYKREFYKPLFNFDVPEIRCLCMTKNNYKNEDAMWSVYRYGSTGSVVKVTYNFYELLKQFNSYCVKNHCTIYVGTIDYSYSQTQIDSFLNINFNEDNYNKFFPKEFTLNNYLKLLLIKRKQFVYENEIRLFIISDNNSFNNGQEKVPLNYDESNLISSILINPYPPQTEIKEQNKSYEKKNEEQAEEIKEKIHSFLNINNRKLQRCRLYESIEVRKITKERVNGLLRKYNYKCSICGNTQNLEIDRIIPKRLSQKDYINSFSIVCSMCNRKKGARFLKDKNQDF